VIEYVDAISTEFEARHAESEFDLATVYFGGGTPSKLGADGVARVMDVVRRRAPIRADAEVTLEANPEDVSRDSARAWRKAGINRVSLGVQSFNDSVLRWMHRTHDAEGARSAVHVLREVGLANISIDLIFATPSSVPRSWGNDVDEALSLALPHLSVYGLTVEPHTPLGRWVARNDAAEAPEEVFEREYLWADSALTSAGFEHYEVSNYGRPTQHSRHNWAYWKRRPYAGLGPSAHEFDGVTRRWNTEAYARWVAQLMRERESICGSELLTSEQALAEQTYLGLRTSAGLPIAPEDVTHVEPWIDAGWAKLQNGSTLRLTASGWLRLDTFASDLTRLRSRY
ncbi:MAG: radical SAM family heme chaperone HemW, partial [Gemmatimonadaceae bacterium]